jgi:hypothetical protein
MGFHHHPLAMNHLAITAMPPIEKAPPSLAAGISPPAQVAFCRKHRAHLVGRV